MLETETTTRRERRIAARKAQLLEAAAHVFSHKGYEKATTKEIADSLFLSPKTVEKYRGQILRKLDCRNQIEAIQKARELGILLS